MLNSTQPSPQDIETRMKNNRKSVENIFNMNWTSDFQDTKVIVEATIKSIDHKYGWQYNGCPSCARKLVEKNSSLICTNCGDLPKTPVAKLRNAEYLYLTSSSSSDSSNEGQNMMEISATMKLKLQKMIH